MIRARAPCAVSSFASDLALAVMWFTIARQVCIMRQTCMSLPLDSRLPLAPSEGQQAEVALRQAA